MDCSLGLGSAECAEHAVEPTWWLYERFPNDSGIAWFVTGLATFIICYVLIKIFPDTLKRPLFERIGGARVTEQIAMGSVMQMRRNSILDPSTDLPRQEAALYLYLYQLLLGPWYGPPSAAPSFRAFRRHRREHVDHEEFYRAFRSAILVQMSSCGVSKEMVEEVAGLIDSEQEIEKQKQVGISSESKEG
uniref:Uncharacterized protein n=1 Tax=Chromera velia CCMP2878 TaxID=1169474 RepID=A0A0G4GPR4_9ALVE|mmetsp:Transcript_36983/g.72732  ORF Transcript_36983/g.72732 Transcript_36983/m.72732 type:complete len:190 (+) Transcript_36983:288-857(+)|eukprot:Cvel_22815.t1-p1 / transcript=Cvel_22815.t1 / gene=Cvel_22815 / organism=Chromera_velia_CCMP2878 / gene_product=hypothetical protein / transcript_product=hypothetical protein / location=Cvel_scaffold2284:21359-23641(+) / protein_length=189 / sequence_SO=supercontig / SO=protein_coding / is_pseudo=false